MTGIEIAAAALGIIGQLVSGASQAIEAAKAEKEDEAFAILFAVLDDAKGSVSALRAKIEANKAEAKKALADKFPVVP